MPKHRARRVSTLRWSVILGICALFIGSISLLVTTSSASAHCFPAWSNCEHHQWPPPTGPTTSSAPSVDPESPTMPTRPPAPAYKPPTGGGATSTSVNNSQQTPNRPPAQLPKQNAPTPGDRDAGIVPLAPTGGGSGGGTGGGVAVESVPTAEAPTRVPAPAAAPDLNAPPQNAIAPTPAPVSTAIDPVSTSAQCLLGTTDSAGCAGADTARDLAPAGLLVLGALALLGSGSFLESLRGSLRS